MNCPVFVYAIQKRLFLDTDPITVEIWKSEMAAINRKDELATVFCAYHWNVVKTRLQGVKRK